MATGHIRKRETKNGISYQVTVEGERDPITGERERHYKTVKGTKKQAEAAMRKLIDEVENGGITTQSAMKLSDWMTQWLVLYKPNLEEKTRASYEERIQNRIIPYLGEIQLKVLNTSHVQKWVNELSQVLSPKSVKNLFVILKPALDQATILRMISFNPCVGVVLPKQRKYQAQVYTINEIRRILNIAKNTNPKMYLQLVLEFSLGLRRGELNALTWDDIDFSAGTININKSAYVINGQRKVKETKTVAGMRTITLDETTLEVLKEEHKKYINKKMNPEIPYIDYNLVICNDNGIPYHPDTLGKNWKKFVKKHNIRQLRYHDLRHSNATTLISSGIDPKTVQERLGHSNVSTTLNTYTHVTKDMDKKAADVINKVIF